MVVQLDQTRARRRCFFSMRHFFDYYVAPVIAGTLVGIAAHDIGHFIGVDAPWWAWAIIFCILWTLSALLSAIKATDSANLARFQAARRIETGSTGT